jgi:L-lactate dehydrogenase complex protein LldG
MMRQTDAGRRDILRAIRENLSASAPHDELRRATLEGHARAHALRLPLLGDNANARSVIASEPMSSRARFQQRLEAVGAQSVVARNEREAASALAAVLSEAGARRVAMSDAPLVERLASQCGNGVRAERVQALSRDDLFNCDVGVTTAQWGIAETGTLVLESAREKNRLLSLVPPAHVAILRTACICDSLADALARVHAGNGSSSRAVTFITGPSRTSDIELTLTIGVHGPQTLHVILLEEAS